MLEDPALALTHELFDLSAAIDLIAQAGADRLGIHPNDLICVHLLLRRGPMSAGEVASAMGLTTAAISAMAGRLEAGGYAHREMDPNDRRRVLLHASPSGTQQVYSLFEGLYTGATEAFSQYKERDLAKLVELLRTYRQLLTDHTVALRRT